MNDFTHDELTLMSIYNASGTRKGLIAELREMRGYLQEDETKLLSLTDSALRKLETITESEFAELDLFPDFA
ncbi:MAG: transposon-transfer assisting family protein [Oscillospiraceae bacterium]|nr:transposon-transfer assisting family protein [Oscillospiraceae bacterium]